MITVNRLFRRGAALLIAASIVFLMVYDVAYGRGFSDWWAGHAIFTSLTSDLLIVGATALIFDEVQAYRQRQDRSVTVAAQGLIVYGQAREAYQAVMAIVTDPSTADVVPDELRDLASNLLVASPSLFDDPAARNFLLELDRLMASLFDAANGHSSRPGSLGQTSHLTDQMNRVQAAFQPLVTRFPDEYQQRVRDADRDIDTDSVTGTDSPDGSGGAPDPGSAS